MSHERILETLSEEELSWTEVDRILVNEETYSDFHANAPADLRSSDHFTDDAPAMRVTEGDEKIVYVDKHGEKVSVNL